jgi:hypothetical protein
VRRCGGGARRAAGKQAPVGWCSWYELGTTVDLASVTRNLADIAMRHEDLGIEYVQLDDGYQSHIGDWLSPDVAKFPGGLGAVAAAILANGLKPGIWLAPFLAGHQSEVFRGHPEWFVRGRRAGRGRRSGACSTFLCSERAAHRLGHVNPDWVSDSPGLGLPGFVYVLDFTHPEALRWLVHVFETLRGFGFAYFKLDFLTLGLKRGARHDPALTRVEAWRLALRTIVRTVGEESYVTGCGAPLGCALGLFDACRISGDVSANWAGGVERYLTGHCVATPASRWALQATVVRSGLMGCWWTNDPDCLLVRCEHWSERQVQTICTLVGMSAGLVFLSDDLTRLQARAEGRFEMVRKILPPSAAATGHVCGAALMAEELPPHFACYPVEASARAGSLPSPPAALHALVNWRGVASSASLRVLTGRSLAALARPPVETLEALVGGGTPEWRGGSHTYVFDFWGEVVLAPVEAANLAFAPYETKALLITEPPPLPPAVAAMVAAAVGGDISKFESMRCPSLVGTTLSLLALTDGRMRADFTAFDAAESSAPPGFPPLPKGAAALGTLRVSGGSMCKTTGRAWFSLPCAAGAGGRWLMLAPEDGEWASCTAEVEELVPDADGRACAVVRLVARSQPAVGSPRTHPRRWMLQLLLTYMYASGCD